MAEQSWLTGLRGAETADGGPIARLGARLAGWTVRAVEATLAVRVWPRSTTHALGDDEARMQIFYPSKYLDHPQDIDFVSNVVSGRMPGEWNHENHQRSLMLEFRHPRRMPATVLVTKADLTHGDAYNPLIGKDTSGWVKCPLKAKTPHVSIAASTGWGKTTTANVLAAQLAFHGWRGLIVDPKRVGFVGAFRNASPNIEIRTTLEGQIQAIWDIREEMNRRYEFIENYVERVDELGYEPMRENPED
ncbi:DUF87 domain-containing protein, partial [Enterobacter sp. Cy-1797]|uniref:helicase HerA domain-containing protein n=1 Tax=Enterobacter sp. Cy-1797 TaxID=2608342 RepID=UPI00141A3907